MTTPSERRAQRAQEKLEKQQASSDVLRASILSEDAFSQPKLVQNPRNSGTKGVPKLYLIVCEDAVSGRFYLEDLVASMQLSSVKVAVFPSTMGTDPRNIVKCAEDKLSANNKIQKAFVVFDGDSALLGGVVGRSVSWLIGWVAGCMAGPAVIGRSAVDWSLGSSVAEWVGWLFKNTYQM